MSRALSLLRSGLLAGAQTAAVLFWIGLLFLALALF
jgi:hypothetical protein